MGGGDGVIHRAKKVTTKKATVKAVKAAKDSDTDEILLKVGMKVMGLWPADTRPKDDDDEWFNGTVLAVDIAKRTCHIKYDDQDEDDEVPWDHVRILEDLDG